MLKKSTFFIFCIAFFISANGTFAETTTVTTTTTTKTTQQIESQAKVDAAYNKFLNEPSDANSQAYKDAQNQASYADEQAAIDEDPTNMAGTSFSLDVNTLTPSQEKYFDGSSNVQQLLRKIARFLLIAIPSLAVLFIVIGGIKIMLAGGDTSKINSGKTIIQFNITAVVISLLSYSIIQLVIWILGSQVTPS